MSQEIKGYKGLCNNHSAAPIVVPVHTLTLLVIGFLESHGSSGSGPPSLGSKGS